LKEDDNKDLIPEAKKTKKSAEEKLKKSSLKMKEKREKKWKSMLTVTEANTHLQDNEAEEPKYFSASSLGFENKEFNLNQNEIEIEIKNENEDIENGSDCRNNEESGDSITKIDNEKTFNLESKESKEPEEDEIIINSSLKNEKSFENKSLHKFEEDRITDSILKDPQDDKSNTCKNTDLEKLAQEDKRNSEIDSPLALDTKIENQEASSEEESTLNEDDEDSNLDSDEKKARLLAIARKVTFSTPEEIAELEDKAYSRYTYPVDDTTPEFLLRNERKYNSLKNVLSREEIDIEIARIKRVAKNKINKKEEEVKERRARAKIGKIKKLNYLLETGSSEKTNKEIKSAIRNITKKKKRSKNYEVVRPGNKRVSVGNKKSDKSNEKKKRVLVDRRMKKDKKIGKIKNNTGFDGKKKKFKKYSNRR